jgi:hypothetical protein
MWKTLWLNVWQAPQHIVGGLAAIGGVSSRCAVNQVRLAEGGWLIEWTSRKRLADGIAFGDIILLRRDLNCPNLLAHEMVHARQSKWLGPLYLPLTVVGYILGGLTSIAYHRRFDLKLAHDASPLEIHADACSGSAANRESNWACRVLEQATQPST